MLNAILNFLGVAACYALAFLLIVFVLFFIVCLIRESKKDKRKEVK